MERGLSTLGSAGSAVRHGSKLGMLCIPLKWDGMLVPAEDDGDFICNMIK
jgi:hypothetical protein